MRNNVIFNYIGQLYITLTGILILPMYLQYMGAEAYGLVGFFTLVQAWMSFLDLGMTPTLGREIARLKGNASEHYRLVTVVNTLECIFLLMALLIGGVLFLGRNWVATGWLSFDELPLETVTNAVAIIAVTVAVRWVSSINRSGVNAFEHQVWMNLIDIFVTTLRFPGSLLLIVLTDGSVMAFFYFQLAVVLVEVGVIRAKLRSLMPDGGSNARRFSAEELRRVAPFALGIGYTGAVWVLLTQLDKLLLSNILPLSEYGYFTLIATISSGLMMLSGPVNKAILPRMTALLAAGQESDMIRVYRRATRLVVAIVAPVTIVIALFPEAVVYTWTGSAEAAEWTAPILPMFILGGGLLAVVSFQYYLQYAHGILRYHVVFNTVSVVINVPLITFAAFTYGAVGVAWVWLGFRAMSFLIWVPFIHHKFSPGLHFQWLSKDVVPGLMIAILIAIGGKILVDVNVEMDRLILFATLSGFTLLAMITAMAVSMQDIIRSKFVG